MKTSFPVRFAHALGLASLLTFCVFLPKAKAQNLVSNSSFETGNWDGTQTFVDPNNASTLLYWNNVVSNWTPNSGSTWVQDAPRASDGNRMVWLGAPPFSAQTYISQPISTLSAGGSLQSNQNYTLTLDYDFFDPTDPQGLMGMDSTIDIYYILGTYMFMGDPGNPMLMDNAATRTQLFTDSGMTDSWLNGANMNWMTANIDFQAPNLSGYDYLRIFIAAPLNTVSTPSMGVLVDNVSLSVAVVPEPSSLALVALATIGWRRRR
jgi:hypothetical protein